MPLTLLGLEFTCRGLVTLMLYSKQKSALLQTKEKKYIEIGTIYLEVYGWKREKRRTITNPHLRAWQQRSKRKKERLTISGFSFFSPILHTSTLMRSLQLLVWFRIQLPEAHYTLLTSNGVAAAAQQRHLTGRNGEASHSHSKGVEQNT